MRWRNREVPTFAGSAGSNGAPAIVEIYELVDRNDVVAATFTKAVDGTVSLDLGESTLQATLTGDEPIEIIDADASTGSHQAIAADLELAATAGRDTSAYKGAIMGNVIGSALTKLGNIVAGIIGKYSIESTNASNYPKAGVIGEVGDSTTTADGAFVAVLGGDSGVTTARAAYTIDNQNSTPNSKFTYGLDLRGVDHDGYGLAEIDNAIRFPDGTTQNTAASGNSVSLETPTGAVNGVNDDFVFTAPPIVVFRNGVNETRLGTIATNTFTFDTAPETGDDIEGLV